MDDIVAQLERQRQKKKKEEQKDTSKPKEQSNSEVHQIAKPFVFGQHTPTTAQNSNISIGGNHFHYDPTTKRYYPKSKPNGDNDVCIQSVQQKIKQQQQTTPFIFGNNNSTSLSNINDNINNKDGSPFLCKDNITDRDIRGVIHLPCLTSNIAGWYGDSIEDMKTAMSTSDTFGWIGNKDGYSFYLNHEGGDDNTSIESAINSLISKRKKKKNGRQNKKRQQNNDSSLNNNNTSNRDPIPNPVESKEEEAVLPVVLPCTQRTSLLLLASSQYCSNSLKRNRINKLLGPLCVARKATIVSTLSKSKDIEQKSTQDIDNDDRSAIPAYPIQSRFYSMLHPLQLPPRNPPYVYSQQTNEQTIPYDCICKSYLEPTNSTFDVLPIYDINSRQRTTNSLPYIATISNDSIYYRPGGTCNNAGSAFEIEMYKGPGQFRFHSVKIAPYSNPEQQMVGGIVLNTGINIQAFAITKAIPNNNQRKMVPCKDLIYDFCFTPSGTLNDPGLVAFACKGTVSFLDLTTGRPWSNYRNNGSEPICVEYRKNNGSNFALFGHRNGGVSMIDTRSVQTQVLTSTNLNLKVDDSFGSATSVQTLERDDNLVVVKGSFGACRLLDLRKSAKIVRSKEKRLTDRSTLLDFTLPESHDIDKMKSTRCTGLAIDASENVIIMPYASSKNDVRFAVWDINTARLIRTLNVNSIIPTSSSVDRPPFCELSSTVTAGYEMRCNDSNDTPVSSIVQGTRGLWFKTSRRVASDTAPAEGGGIHHIRF